MGVLNDVFLEVFLILDILVSTVTNDELCQELDDIDEFTEEAAKRQAAGQLHYAESPVNGDSENRSPAIHYYEDDSLNAGAVTKVNLVDNAQETFKCSKCAKNFNSESELHTHMKEDHPTKNVGLNTLNKVR